MPSITPPPQQVSSKQIAHLSYQELDILHSLRGLCAFYVVIFHAKYILWSGGTEYLRVHPRATWELLDYIAFGFDLLSSAGYEMVIFFFALSGFFIRYAQLRKHRAPLSFYRNRIVRIYPPYLVSVLLACLVLALLMHGVPQVFTSASNRELNTHLLESWQQLSAFNWKYLLRALSFLTVGSSFPGYNQVYWSLLPEGLFYLLVPFFFWRIRWYYWGSALLYAINLANLGDFFPDNILADYLLTYNFYFMLGAILYDIVLRTTWLERVRHMQYWLLILCGLGLFGATIGLTLLHLKTYSGLMAALLAVISISALLAGKVSAHNPLMRILHKLGIFSFSLYLYHFPLLLLCYGGLVYFTGETVFYARYYWLAIPIVTLVSYMLYWVTERASVNYFRKV
jgi:peptidoglycan/LPS O-acetylase OafA/YrhL